MSVTLRALTPDDWQPFAAIRLEALRDNPGLFSSNYAVESTYAENEWRDWLRTKDRCLFGLIDEGIIVGIMGVVTRNLDPTGTTGMIVSVFIKPDYRGQGLSDLLYKACIEWGIHYPTWSKIIVAHRANNDAARKPIQKHGFVFTHREPRTWPDGGVSDEVWYELDLAALRK